jgi:hypothetical protein
LDKPIIGSGDGGIAENIGVIDRIDSVQAARLHEPAAMMAAIEKRPTCRSRAQDTEGADRKRDESLPRARNSG